MESTGSKGNKGNYFKPKEISPKLLNEMLAFSKNPSPIPNHPVILQKKKHDWIPTHTLRINADDFADLIESNAEAAEAKKIKADANASSGGYKNAKDKYTVKDLKTIASRNNIKTTKKLNGKTVPLNKKGLVAKLKRNKVI